MQLSSILNIVKIDSRRSWVLVSVNSVIITEFLELANGNFNTISLIDIGVVQKVLQTSTKLLFELLFIL